MEHSQEENKETDASLEKNRGDLEAFRDHLSLLNSERRQVLNDLLDLKGNFRVFCRIKPFFQGNRSSNMACVTALDSNSLLLRQNDNKRKQYDFDKVFHPQATQEEVFMEVEPVIKSALDGYNVCIFAYGQTGTGKTFTMEGKPESPGVVPRAIKALFERSSQSSHKFQFRFSMLEIYMGKLRDLLLHPRQKRSRSSLTIQTNMHGGIEIENLAAIEVSSLEQVNRLYRLGYQLRSTASTMSNETSSRSHCLIRIAISSSHAPERRRDMNKIWLIDLGGSERLIKTCAKGKRLEEGKAINLSLSALGDVISALQRRNPHIPYRNSKLTQVLRDSLGEDSKTLMLVHVSSKEDDLNETVCSLMFATRVRNIHMAQEESTELKAIKEATITKLFEKLSHLEIQCQDTRRQIQKLMEKLTQLERSGTVNNKHSEDLLLSNERLKHVVQGTEKCLTGVTEVSVKQPRFMKPTFCSLRKRGSGNQIQETQKKKTSVSVKRTKSSASTLESVNRHLESALQCGYTLECDVSREGSLDWNIRADIITGYNQEASECEIKTVISPELQKSMNAPKAFVFSGNTIETGIYGADRLGGDRHLAVDTAHKGKHLTADNWNQGQTREQNQLDCQQGQEAEATTIHNETKTSNKQHATFISEEVDFLTYISCADRRYFQIDEENPNCSYHEYYSNCSDSQHGEAGIDEVLMTKALSSKNPSDLFSQAILISEVCEEESCEHTIKVAQENEKDQFFYADEQDIKPNQDVFIDDEKEIKAPKLDEKTVDIDGKNERKYGHLTSMKNSKNLSLGRMKLRRIVILEANLSVSDQKDAGLKISAVPKTNPEKERQNTGIGLLLGQTVNILWTSVLFGLGFESLGLGSDFFNGLTF